MPKRLVDGEALWRSDKIAKVNPPEFRAEYANMLPLALADGTFECNPRRVWADVYSYNRPEFSLEKVVEVLNEFERVGLLIRQTDPQNRVWGKWTGIERHLPPPSQLDRYKNGNSSIFTDSQNIQSKSRVTLDEIKPGLVLDRNRIGIGEEHGQGDWKTISIRFRRAFGRGIPNRKEDHFEYFAACQQWGEDKVLEMFDIWQGENQWIRDKKYSAIGLRKFYEAMEELTQVADENKNENVEDNITSEQAHALVDSQVEKELQEVSLKKAQENQAIERRETWFG